MRVYKPLDWQASLGYGVDPARCAASVHDDFGVGFHQCYRKGTIERDGYKWCKQHDPEAVKARQEERAAKYQAYWDQQKLNDIHAKWMREAVEVARQIAQGHNDPMTFAREYLAREPK